jgi:hypothetical protein
MKKTLTLCLGALLFFAIPAFAQWENVRTPRVARTPDGKVKLDAPAPRRNGKPDEKDVPHYVQTN